jgi:ribosome-binding factor A
MGVTPRSHRVADRIQIELSDIIQTEMKDPRHGFMTLTRVEVAEDLRSARVFVSTLEDDKLDATLETLDRAKGFLRTELGKRIRLRHTPELHFRPDRSAVEAVRIAKLLRDLETGDAPRGDVEDD